MAEEEWFSFNAVKYEEKELSKGSDNVNIQLVADHFEKEASYYDELIIKLIPKYHEQHEIILKLIPNKRTDKLKFLDLGSGTGILSLIILKNFPNANIVLFDLSQHMLDLSIQNLSLYKERISLKKGNFETDDFGINYDIILSGLSIHHLDTLGKQKLYKRIYEALVPGGIFYNRDIVLGATPKLSEVYHHQWKEFIRTNGEDEEKWFNKYLSEDKPSTLENQLHWLEKSNFTDVGCHWKYFNFTIFSGSKSIDSLTGGTQ